MNVHELCERMRNEWDWTISSDEEDTICLWMGENPNPHTSTFLGRGGESIRINLSEFYRDDEKNCSYFYSAKNDLIYVWDYDKKQIFYHALFKWLVNNAHNASKVFLDKFDPPELSVD